MPRWLPLAVAFLFAASSRAEITDTDRGWIHVDGYTYHMIARHCNDLLLGTGVTWYTRYTDSVHLAWEGDVFADSAKKLSAYVGYSAAFAYRGVSLGATGAIMYHRNFVAENRFRTLPVAFPFLETGTHKFKIRVYYVPPVRRASDEQVAVQLLLPWWK